MFFWSWHQSRTSFDTLFFFAQPFIYIEPSQTSEMHQFEKLSSHYQLQ